MLSFLKRSLDPRSWWGTKTEHLEDDAEFEFSAEGAVGASTSLEDERVGSAETENGASDGETKWKPNPEREDADWVKVPSKLALLAEHHPFDPHEPSFSELLPAAVRPYPSFEGWFIRVWDATAGFSAAVIMATNYATGESQVTILFALGADAGGSGLVKRGCTYAVAVTTKVGFLAPGSHLLSRLRLCGGSFSAFCIHHMHLCWNGSTEPDPLSHLGVAENVTCCWSFSSVHGDSFSVNPKFTFHSPRCSSWNGTVEFTL